MEKRTNANPKRKRAKPKTPNRTLRRLMWALVIVAFVLLTGIGCGFLTATMNVKDNIAEDIRPPATSTIYDANGQEIATVHAAENRMPVKIHQIPKDLQHAFIAVEDNRFYEHSGIDPKGILRALWANISGRTISEGGSTITQQLAKNAYLTQDRTWRRKVQEMFLALQLERQYTKQEILEFYLNQIYFGQGAYGVQAAAKTYFGKNVEDLTLSESAMLAGIPKSPNYYSPFNNLQAAQDRKGIVLDQMVKYGYIKKSAAIEAKHNVPTLVPPSQIDYHEAAYFVDYVTQLLVDRYGADAVYKDGLKIYTTLDMDMQHAAEAAMQHLPDYFTDDSGIVQPQGALVAIDPKTGYIKAMVGGRGTDQFNRATMAERQPGSAFKPFVFAAALENKFSASTLIDDSPIKVGDWEPQNYNRNFNGKVPLRYVAEQSLNVPTVKVAQKVGIDTTINYAQEMGISTFVLDGPQNDRNLATALGGLTKGVTPLELTSAYGTFANNGVHVAAVAIIRVLDRNGQILDETEPDMRAVISEESAAELTGMLEGVIIKGTGTRANIGRPAAGKTGTTSDYHDAWFVGYTPDLVAGVWIGNDNNTSLGGMGGGNDPAQIWRIFMMDALASTPVHDFEGVQSYRGDSMGELENDEKISVKKKKEKAEPSTAETGTQEPQRDAKEKTSNVSQEILDNQRAAKAPVEIPEPAASEPPPVEAPTPAAVEPEPAAVPEPAQEPSAGPSEVPEMGGGVSKGRN